jgi:hypothetical protein
MTFIVREPSPGLGQAQKGGSVKLVNGIPPICQVKANPQIYMDVLRMKYTGGINPLLHLHMYPLFIESGSNI